MPRHRGAAHEPTLKKTVGKSVLFSGLAVAVTGVAVTSGIALESGPSGDTAAASLASALAHRHSYSVASSSPVADRRTSQASRSGGRTALDTAKRKTLDQQSGGQATHTENLASSDPRDIARALLPQFGYSPDQFACLDSLYMSESGWNIHATNSTSGAYGIPQALPASKMSAAGPDWQTSAATQIKWGLEYIKSSYGSPCGAWDFKASHNWY